MFYRSPSKQYARRTVAASSRDSILSERNPADPTTRPNATHSPSYDSIQYYTSAAAVAAAAANTHSSRSAHAQRVPNSQSFPNSSTSTPVAGASARAVSPMTRPSSALSNSAFSTNPSNNVSATSPPANTLANHKYYAPSSGLNSASSSMVNFHQTTASSSRTNLPFETKANGGYAAVPSAWSNQRHTPSPAPSLPTAMTRSDSLRNSARSSNAPAYESASLDRKDNRKSVASSSQSDFARYSQTMSATESRSLRRSKRGKATINSSAPAAGDEHKTQVTSSNRETDE